MRHTPHVGAPPLPSSYMSPLSFCRSFGAAGLVAAAALAPATVDAQTLRLTGLSAGAPTATVATQTTTFGPTPNWTHTGTSMTVRSSPYLATMTPVGGTATAIQVICADILSAASFRRTYAVNVTSLAGAPTLVDTRWVDGVGVHDKQGVLQETLTNAAALSRYRQASYLGAFLTADNTAQWDDIQLAIWKIMTPFTIRSTVTAWTSRSSQAWLERAQAAAADGFVGYTFANAMVLTDATVDDGMHDGQSQELQGQRAQFGRQEFVTAAQVVPEPSTYLLVGTGLAGLLVLAGRRRQD